MKNTLVLDSLEAARNEDQCVKLSQEAVDCLNSGELFQGKTLINIIHDGECYQLRVTRQNKLLLTKPGTTAFK